MIRSIIGLILPAALFCDPLAAQQAPRAIKFDGALFEYSAEGQGPVVVAFTGSENIGHQLYSTNLRERLTLVHADPSNIPADRLRQMTMDSVIDDVERLRLALRLEKIGVMGHSMFAALPLEYALKYPQHIQWAILTGALPYTTAAAAGASEKYWSEQASDERKATRVANHKALQAHASADRSASDRFWDVYEADVPYRFYNARFDLKPFRAGLHEPVKMDFVDRFWNGILKDYDQRAAYRNIAAPVLVLAGKYDFGAPYFLWDDVVPTMPRATFHLFENAGHNPMLESPADFDRVLLAWIAGH